jgi:hypothetical protein
MHLTSILITLILHFVVMNHLESFCILLQIIITFLNNKKYIVHLFIIGTWKVKDIAHIIQGFADWWQRMI